MKAVRIHNHGDKEVLQFEDIPDIVVSIIESGELNIEQTSEMVSSLGIELIPQSIKIKRNRKN